LFERAREPDGRDTDLHICLKCSVVTTTLDPRYDPEAQGAIELQAESSLEFYESRLPSGPELTKEIDAHEGILSALNSRQNGFDKRIFMELGYGRGLLLLAAARKYRRVYGIELQHKPFQLLAERVGGVPSNVHLVSEPDEIDERVDVLTMWHTLEHLTHPLRVLRPFVERLLHGGLVFAQVPLFRPQYMCMTHYWFHNGRSIRVLAQTLGLRPLDVMFDTQNGFLTLIAAKVPSPFSAATAA
jgi:Methyltransferase domain